MKKLEQLSRFRKVVFALFRYGFDDIVNRLDLPAKFLVSIDTKYQGSAGTYERIRLMLEELGPTFIKIGQVLSVRPDLVPAGLIRELKRLQSQVEPIAFQGIREVVETSLSAPLTEYFTLFEETPIAAASLAQVHRAVLKDNGEVVAVKVLKPDMRKIIDADLGLIEYLAETLDNRVEAFRTYDLPGIVQELKLMLMNEVNFLKEARKMQVAREHLKQFQDVRIPKVYKEYTTERVLCMELLQGRVLSDVDLEELSDRQAMGKSGLHVIVKQILEDGFFHADPHPGNLLVLKDMRSVALLDWGMTGRLSRTMRYRIVDLIEAVTDRNSERIVDTLLDITSAGPGINKQALEREIMEIVDIYATADLKDIHVGDMMLDMTNLLRARGIKIPADLAIMIKGLLTGEGTARLLCPELNVIREAEPYVREMVKERFRFNNLWKGFKRSMLDIISLQKKLPNLLERIFLKVEQGEIKIRFQHEGLEGLQKTLDRVTNRLSLAVMVAAIFLGSSMIITTGMEPHIYGYPALGVIGYSISGLLGLWLIYKIISKKKY